MCEPSGVMLARAGQGTSDAVISDSSETDLQRYLKRASDDHGDKPAVPPKDSPSTPRNVDSHFNPRGLPRAESVFSFSRTSISSQLSALTFINFPSPESLSAGVSAIPTAPKAVRALANAADQIQTWAGKALKILENLDAHDDVEWAAAAGREGLDESDKAVRKFGTLVEIYVQAIDGLQMRPDVGDVKAQGLQRVVEQMESTLAAWNKVKNSLKGVHDQVELAMEWEELWGTVLGDVGEEMENLSRLVFEMEEKRHMSMREDEKNEGGEGIDLNELEHFLHDRPKHARTSDLDSNGLSLPSGLGPSPLASPALDKTVGDSNLLALFARMQPLRASLDFLPMRLSMFQARANKIFPTVCKELEDRRARLEKGWAGLEKEAEDLRRELGEDRWVLVFRNAGRQAEKMCESVERSITRLQEALESGAQHNNPSAMGKRVESFEAKRLHYGPAIDRVLAIISKGVRDRLTVNGEVIRLHTDMTARVQAMHRSIKIMEATLEEANANHNPQLRDSISSVITMDRSMSGSFNDTPGSSPASSVVTTGGRTDTTAAKGCRGYRSASSSRPLPSHNRFPSGGQKRRPATPLASRSANPVPSRAGSPSQGPGSIYRQGLYRPPTASLPRPGPTPISDRPRWSSGGKATSPTPAAGVRSASTTTTPANGIHSRSPRSGSSLSSMLAASPLSRGSTASPVMTRGSGARRGSYLPSFAERACQSVATSSVPGRRPLHRGRNVTAPTNSSPHVGTIRSPSSLAVSKRSESSARRPLSTLAHHSSSSKGLQSNNNISQIHPDDSGIDTSGDELDAALEPELDADDESHVSPSTRRKATPRPSSVVGWRLSMLPVPTIKGKGPGSVVSGRESSLGSRPLWK